jgi:putative holliday junction resolvase
MRVLALDHGSARCGVAVSDPSGTLATPLPPILRPDTKKGLQRVKAVVEETRAERVVVGLPVSLRGGDSDQTRAARAFAQKLEETLAVPVELYDERFTTSLARRAGGAASLDSRAAAVLLDEWLNRSGDLPIEGQTE